MVTNTRMQCIRRASSKALFVRQASFLSRWMPTSLRHQTKLSPWKNSATCTKSFLATCLHYRSLLVSIMKYSYLLRLCCLPRAFVLQRNNMTNNIKVKTIPSSKLHEWFYSSKAVSLHFRLIATLLPLLHLRF